MADGVGLSGFETASVRMEPYWLVSLQIPEGEAETLMEKLAEAVPLTMGHYDRCAFQSAPGIERYRPREGAAAGAEEDTRKRPGVVEISFQIPRDPAILAIAIEAVAASHSYQEPVVTVCEILASRSKGGGDHNPNRWWNKGGDWMKAS